MIKRRVKSKRDIFSITIDNGTGDRRYVDMSLINTIMMHDCSKIIKLTPIKKDRLYTYSSDAGWWYAEWMLEPATCIQR